MSTIDKTAKEFFSGHAAPDLQTELPPEIVALEKLFGKAEAQDNEKFAEMTGAPKPVTTQKVKLVVKNKVFNLSRVADAKLFATLVQNHTKYSILQTDKSWGPDGAFRMWVLYSDNLEVKAKDEDEIPSESE